LDHLYLSFEKQQVAQQILTQFQDHEEAWTKVDGILEHSKVPQTKVSIRSLIQHSGLLLIASTYLSLYSSLPCKSWRNSSKQDGIPWLLKAVMVREVERTVCYNDD
jgi:hypothetical protein